MLVHQLDHYKYIRLSSVVHKDLSLIASYVFVFVDYEYK